MFRVASRALQLLLDLGSLSAAFVLAFLLRFDWDVPWDFLRRCFVLLPYVVGLKYFVLTRFDVPRFAWRYVGLRESVRILQALSIASAVLLALRLVALPLSQSIPAAQHVWIPIGTIVIDWMLSFGLIVGLRVGRRMLSERDGRRRDVTTAPNRVPTLMIGAGQAGLLVAREIEARRDLGMSAVGFVDDDPLKRGTMVHGVPVLGATDDLARIVSETGAKQALVTIASAHGREMRRLVRLCEQAGLPVKTIPPMSEIVGGKVNLTRVRNVAIEDLLRREPIRLDEDAIARAASGKTVLVTGAGGSIGSELCRQLCRFEPASIVLVERSENALFEIHRELRDAFPNVHVVPAIGDITDEARMRAVFSRYAPSFVLHAAAHKHVPMMEWNPGEAVKNNVFGTKCVADIALEAKVETFVLISTDKAVNPSSVMGTTKRVAELYLQTLSERGSTRFVAVRFGNVLGSAGSVIPIFREQIQRGGPVTVTHPDMRRFFMTIPEASQLVLQAATMGKGGEIFILDMGEPVRIVDLAEDLIRLSGLRPGEDVEIQFSGVRPGEKLYEELSVADESADKTYHPKIFVGRIAGARSDELHAALARLEPATQELDAERMRELLRPIVPEMVTPEPTMQPPPVRAVEVSHASKSLVLVPAMDRQG